MNKRVSKTLTMILPLAVGILIGSFFLGGGDTDENDHTHELAVDGIWTCSMHPQVRQPEAGACPFCGMDLIPVSNEGSEDPTVLKMSNAAIQLANIQTTVLQATGIEGAMKLNGRIKADERRVNTQTTHFGARIEVLYKNYRGEKVRKGDKIASLYSPELLAAQEELLEAKKLEKSNPVLLAAARKKLNYWKLTREQITRIEESKSPMRNFDLLAGFDGVITEKLVNSGDHLHEGEGLLEITDLSNLWVVFEVYERDLEKIKLGDKISFTSRASSKARTATISFISPEVDPQSRIVEVRADIANTDNRLKPDMFVEGSLRIDSQGSLMAPKSAVLWTGKRSIVYVKIAGEQSFELREVLLGESMGDYYEIKEGLSVNEEVVTNGAFTLDAEAQLRGKISMMNPATEAKGTLTPEEIFKEVELPEYKDYQGLVTATFQEQVASLSEAYISLKDQMVAGKGNNIRKTGLEVKTKLTAMNESPTDQEALSHWKIMQESMQVSIETITTSEDRDFQRLEFINLSKAMINTVQSFGTSFESPLYVQFCPMANNDKGATWISKSEEIINPYFGDAMLNCGNVEEVIDQE